MNRITGMAFGQHGGVVIESASGNDAIVKALEKPVTDWRLDLSAQLIIPPDRCRR